MIISNSFLLFFDATCYKGTPKRLHTHKKQTLVCNSWNQQDNRVTKTTLLYHITNRSFGVPVGAVIATQHHLRTTTGENDDPTPRTHTPPPAGGSRQGAQRVRSLAQRGEGQPLTEGQPQQPFTHRGRRTALSPGKILWATPRRRGLRTTHRPLRGLMRRGPLL